MLRLDYIFDPSEVRLEMMMAKDEAELEAGDYVDSGLGPGRDLEEQSPVQSNNFLPPVGRRLAAMLCSIEWKISVVFSNQEADLEIVKILVNSHRPDNESLLPVYPLLISAPFSASRSSFWSPGWWRQPEVSSYPGPPLPSSSILLTTALNIPSLSSWSWVPLYSVYSYSFLLLS